MYNEVLRVDKGQELFHAGRLLLVSLKHVNFQLVSYCKYETVTHSSSSSTIAASWWLHTHLCGHILPYAPTPSSHPQGTKMATEPLQSWQHWAHLRTGSRRSAILTSGLSGMGRLELCTRQDCWRPTTWWPLRRSFKIRGSRWVY